MTQGNVQLETAAPAQRLVDRFSDAQSPAKPVKRILAIASGGGHWVQLCRLVPVFEGHDVAFLTTIAGNKSQIKEGRFYHVHDASRWNKLGLMRLALQMAWILVRERPDVILSTGAAIGYIGIRLGKFVGARTIWVDSIANVEKLSLSGRHVGRHADLWLTQWPHLARPEGPQYFGAVL
jgi:exopolysaccharide biosynthesis glucuronosyltransferase PssD